MNLLVMMEVVDDYYNSVSLNNSARAVVVFERMLILMLVLNDYFNSVAQQ
jgi:hypothetical protein